MVALRNYQMTVIFGLQRSVYDHTQNNIQYKYWYLDPPYIKRCIM